MAAILAAILHDVMPPTEAIVHMTDLIIVELMEHYILKVKSVISKGLSVAKSLGGEGFHQSPLTPLRCHGGGAI